MATRALRRAARTRAPHETPGRRRWWPWAKKNVVPSVLFAVPAYFASKLVQHLGGGALWFPREWRETVGIFGLLIGLAVFHYARSLAGRARKGSHPQEARAQLMSLRCYGLALLVLGVYVFLRHWCVYSWSPRHEWLELHEVTTAGAADLPSFIEQAPQELARARAPDASATGPIDVWRGSFLVPLFFSAGTRAGLAAIEREKGRDPILYCLECNEEWLIDRIEFHEGFSMAVTTLVFFVTHMGVLVFACLGFGSAFSASEEAASELARIV